MEAPGFVAIIDGDGQFWVNLEKLRARFDTSVNRNDLDDFMVRNMGYVRLSVANSRVEVRLRPRLVSDTTLAALLYWLADNPTSRCIAMLHNDDASIPTITILPVGNNRLMVLGQLIAASKAPETTVSRRQEIREDQLKECSSLMRSIEYWKISRGLYSDTDLEQILSETLRSRFILLRQNDTEGALIVYRVGSGLPTFAHNTLIHVVGQNIEHQPDQAYGKACSEAYVEAICRWQPLLEIVDARAFWPGHGRLRRSYVRLILPLRNKKNRIAVLSTTLQSAADLLRSEAC
jgi:hypothetical protein